MSTQFIVMGVSGSGKSTVGRMLAETWGVPFIEGDTLHSEVSVAKMAAGIPLDDADRLPWLDRIGEAVAAAAASGRGAVVSCSALKLAYRDRLRVATGPHLRFAMLDLRREVLETRMGERKGHYMPPSLLDSQLRTLERPKGEADVLVVDGEAPLADITDSICRWRVDLLTAGETW